MCFNNETMSLNLLSSYVQNSVVDIISSFSPSTPAVSIEKHIRWNNNNFDCAILNVDGSCFDNPIRAGFGGLIRNSAGSFLAGFSGFLPSTSDILQAELTAIFHGLSMAKEMEIVELVCYSDSLLSINLIVGNTPRFHVYAVLIQEIKVLLSQANYALYHTLREGNQYADSLAKRGASSDVDFNLHQTPLMTCFLC
jgi:ribonuclease HI